MRSSSSSTWRRERRKGEVGHSSETWFNRITRSRVCDGVAGVRTQTSLDALAADRTHQPGWEKRKSRIQRLGCTDVINRLYCGSGDQHIDSQHRKEERSPGYKQWRQFQEESGAAWCVKMFHLKIRNVSRSGIVFFRSREVRESNTMDSLPLKAVFSLQHGPKHTVPLNWYAALTQYAQLSRCSGDLSTPASISVSLSTSIISLIQICEPLTTSTQLLTGCFIQTLSYSRVIGGI